MAREWTVTEATPTVAFLSDGEGWDVAALKRLPDELFETGAALSGDEWQSMIDLVAAAPLMLRCVKEYIQESRKLGWGCSSLDSMAVEAVRKAEGRSE